jgi:hypothetical protein
MLFHDLRYIFRAQFLVKNIFGQYKHYRPHGTKPVAPGLNDTDLPVKFPSRNFSSKRVLERIAAARPATGPTAKHQLQSDLVHYFLLHNVWQSFGLFNDQKINRKGFNLVFLLILFQYFDHIVRFYITISVLVDHEYGGQSAGADTSDGFKGKPPVFGGFTIMEPKVLPIRCITSLMPFT